MLPFFVSGFCTSCTLLSSPFSLFNFSVSSSTFFPERSVSLNCSLSILMEYSISLILAEFSLSIVRLTSSVSFLTISAFFPACSNSLLYLSMTVTTFFSLSSISSSLARIFSNAPFACTHSSSPCLLAFFMPSAVR